MSTTPSSTPKHEKPPQTKPDPRAAAPPSSEDDRVALRRRADAAMARLTPSATAVVPVRTVLLWGCALGLLVVIAFAILGVYTLSLGSKVSDTAVAENRVKAGGEVLGSPGQGCDPVKPESVTFECLNQARVALGLAPVAPIEGLAPSQLGAVLGEERAELRRVRAERGGSSSAGVTTPGQGRFPGGR